MGGAIKDLLSQQQTAYRSVHKAMTAETIHAVKTIQFRNPAENRVGIGSNLIEAGPSADNPCIFQNLHPFHGCFKVLQFPLAIYRHTETSGLIRIGDASKNPLPLSMKIE